MQILKFIFPGENFTVLTSSYVLGLLNVITDRFTSSIWHLSALKINGCSLLLLDRFGPSFIKICFSKRDDGFGIFGNRNVHLDACKYTLLQVNQMAKLTFNAKLAIITNSIFLKTRHFWGSFSDSRMNRGNQIHPVDHCCFVCVKFLLNCFNKWY